MIGDTIAAVSTPYGKGGVALLRVSGPEAVALCETVFLPAGGERLAALEARRATYGRILAPDERGEWHSVDDGIVTVFRAPASFTGEDTVEICCHGGILLTETVLSALFCAGARPAEASSSTTLMKLLWRRAWPTIRRLASRTCTVTYATLPMRMP